MSYERTGNILQTPHMFSPEYLVDEMIVVLGIYVHDDLTDPFLRDLHQRRSSRRKEIGIGDQHRFMKKEDEKVLSGGVRDIESAVRGFGGK